MNTTSTGRVVKTDPAIFLYLDPTETKEEFENTLAHELHHIGYGSGCLTSKAKEEIARAKEYQHEVINDDLDTALAAIRAILRPLFERNVHAG